MQLGEPRVETTDYEQYRLGIGNGTGLKLSGVCGSCCVLVCLLDGNAFSAACLLGISPSEERPNGAKPSIFSFTRCRSCRSCAIQQLDHCILKLVDESRRLLLAGRWK